MGRSLKNSRITPAGTVVVYPQEIGSIDKTIIGLTEPEDGRFLNITLDNIQANTATIKSTTITGGGSVSGNITLTGGATINGVPTPVASTDAANKAYVDAVASSLNVHAAVDALSTGNLIATYTAGRIDASGGLGISATLTATTANVALVVDSYTVTVGARVLVAGQTDQTQNGIYTLTTDAATGVSWVLTRATDYNDHTAGEVAAGDFVYVSEGATYAKTGWTQTNVGTSTSPVDAIKIGTDPIAFTQFSGAGSYTAGTGLQLVGGQFSVIYGAGVAPVPSGDVGIDLYSTTSGALFLTEDGSTRSANAAAKLGVLLAASGGLTQDATGLYIPTAGVTNAMLVNSSGTIDADTGSGVFTLGGSINIFGTLNRVTTNITSGNLVVDISNIYVGQSSISTVGTITTGTWNGTTIDVANGGTGKASTTANALLLGNGTSALTEVTAGTTGQVLTIVSGVPTWASPAISTFNEQTGTTYTFALSDANYNTMTAFNNASAVTVTLSSVTGFSVGASIDFIQKGVGKVTISPLGVTVNSVSSYLSISAQYGAATLIQESTNVWYLIGSLAA